MGTIIHLKMKAARESLGITQVAASKEAKYNQSQLSLMESGETTFIPNNYLSWMAKHGADLNGIFNPDVSLEMYKDMCTVASEKLSHPPVDTSHICQKCEEKDHQIKTLEQYVDDLRFMIRKPVNPPENTSDPGS